MTRLPGARPVRANRGTTLTAKSWSTEAPLRMLQNNLDPEVAEDPDNLVVYGGTGKAARDWASFDAISRSLIDLERDETLLVQSGRPVGILRTHEWAPRVLIANSNLVGDWATWPEFRRLEAMGLTMYGQMTAGSWIYIGSQGIVQGTYETFAAVADKRFGGSLAGTLTLTAGLGGMGGAQPLAVTLNGGVALCIEVDPARAKRRVQTRYLDVVADSLEDGTELALAAKAAKQALSVAVVGNAADVLPELLRRGIDIDIVTDQTSAHDPLWYLPSGVALEDWHDYAAAKPDEFTDRARASMATHVEAMVGFQDAGAEVFDYGNSIRGEARLAGYERAFDFPGFVPAYIRPLFAQGKGPFRWAALSGDPADIRTTDVAVQKLFPDNEKLQRWMRLAPEKIAFQGLPARICWLGVGERHLAGLRFNEMVAAGEIGAPRRSAAITWIRAPSPRRTGRQRRWPTGAMRSPIGRCSMHWSTRLRVPPGCRSTTAAASESGVPSTPGRCASPMEPNSPHRSWTGCSPMIRLPACFGMWMPGMPKRTRQRRVSAWSSPWPKQGERDEVGAAPGCRRTVRGGLVGSGDAGP